MARVVMLVSNQHDPDPRVQKAGEALVEGGHEVTILAYDRQGSGLPAAETLDGVEIRRLQPRPAPYGGTLAVWRGLRAFAAACRPIIRDLAPDVVHCHDMDTCRVGRWWQRQGGRFVFESHDRYWTWLTMPNPRSLVRRAGAVLLERQDRRFARAADLVVTVSEGKGPRVGFAERYRSLGAETIVTWSAPRERPDPLPPLPERFTLGYVGNVREPEMFEWLITAILALPEEQRPRLFVAGGGRSAEAVRTLLETAAAEHGLDVEVRGRYAEHEQSELIEQCTVQWAVYPPRPGHLEHTMSVKLLESVAHGRLVITNADTLMGDWVEAHDWGWTVTPRDVPAITRLLAEAHVRTASGAALELEAPPLWPEQAARLRDAYDRLLAA